MLMAATIAGCAAHYGVSEVHDPYGFFSGIWHGMIFPIALTANFLSWLAGLLGFSLMDSIHP